MAKQVHPDRKRLRQAGHEARKPLVSLIGTADLLLTGIQGELPTQVRIDVEQIKADAEAALKSVDQLITFCEEIIERND